MFINHNNYDIVHPECSHYYFLLKCAHHGFLGVYNLQLKARTPRSARLALERLDLIMT